MYLALATLLALVAFVQAIEGGSVSPPADPRSDTNQDHQAVASTEQSPTPSTSTSTTSPPPQPVITQAPPPTQTLMQQQQESTLSPTCLLGNETYLLGERWNPNLPPFGVQVCVQCECILRQRKNCYEAKVTCRRIINECPIIDSCPDGKRPVTIAGQCCKSCQSDTAAEKPPLSIYGNNNNNTTANTTDSSMQQQQPFTNTQLAQMNDRLVAYKNERIKEYQSIIENQRPCPKPREGDKHMNSVHNVPKAPKQGNSKNDLNGIDSRLAFKSLHDSQGNPHSIAQQPKTNREMKKPASPVDDTLRHNHQHPNDVQSQSSGGNPQGNRQFQFATTRRPPKGDYGEPSSQRRPQASSPGTCFLGNDTYQLGDRWNPILPPLGVQVCVQCDCILRQKKNCYETKLTCKRINNECPVIDSCPDGERPVTVAGQCCKSCQSEAYLTEQQKSPLNFNTATNDGIPEPVSQLGSSLQMADRPVVQKSERFKEYQTIIRNMQPCGHRRDGIKAKRFI